MTQSHIIETPLGNLSISADVQGLTEVRFCQPATSSAEQGADPLIEAAAAQLGEYFTGLRQSFDLPLNPRGTEFQRQVWRQLLAVACGETASYASIAGALGNAKAARAVGAAAGRNPLTIIVPCHRIVGQDGSLTGYAGGLKRKQWLLAHERKMLGIDE